MPITCHTPTNNHIAELADYVRLHNTDELDLRDAAADVDNGQVTGDLHLVIALVASLDHESAATILQSLFEYLGWECDHGHPLATGCEYCD